MRNPRRRPLLTSLPLVPVAAAAMLASSITSASAQSLDLGDFQTVVGTTGLTSALFATGAPGQPTNRLFIVEQAGRIRVVTGTTVQTNAVIDIRTTVLGSGVNSEFGLQGDSEQGLLGLAFHPNFTVNRFFYVYYTEPRGATFTSQGSTFDRGRSVVARYTMNVIGTGDITASAASAQIVMRFDQSFTNHNGGCINFGADGLLYIGTGDGGAGDDPNNVALNPNSMLGKMLRIDVDSDGFPADVNRNYAIPATNPTNWPTGAGGTQTGLPELWAIGLRNPWRWSFDRVNQDLWIADVGQNIWEEVNWTPADYAGGRNYGWRRFEGFAERTTIGIGTFSVANRIEPVYVYPHNVLPGYLSTQTGFSITGGYVYRGSAIPGWRGRYFFGDYVSGRIWSLRRTENSFFDFQDHTPHLGAATALTSFAQDNDGELYTLHFSGSRLRKIVPSTISLNLSIADLVQGGGLPGPDGNVDGEDFQAFLNAFGAGEELADLVGGNGNPPGDANVDGNDFQAFLNAFAAGN